MCDANLTVPGRNRTADCVLQAQAVPCDCAAKDINQGVDRSHLVKMHLLDRASVNFRLGLSNPSKNSKCQILCRSSCIDSIKHRLDFAEAAVDLVGWVVQRHPQSSKAMFLYRPPLQHDPGNPQRFDPAKHCLAIGPRIDQACRPKSRKDNRNRLFSWLFWDCETVREG
jgi:hypothetical protein